MTARNENVPVAVTMGDPAGVGLDIVLSAWRKRRELNLPALFLIADPVQTAARAATLGADVEVREIASPAPNRTETGTSSIAQPWSLESSKLIVLGV